MKKTKRQIKFKNLFDETQPTTSHFAYTSNLDSMIHSVDTPQIPHRVVVEQHQKQQNTHVRQEVAQIAKVPISQTTKPVVATLVVQNKKLDQAQDPAVQKVQPQANKQAPKKKSKVDEIKEKYLKNKMEKNNIKTVQNPKQSIQTDTQRLNVSQNIQMQPVPKIEEEKKIKQIKMESPEAFSRQIKITKEENAQQNQIKIQPNLKQQNQQKISNAKQHSTISQTPIRRLQTQQTDFLSVLNNHAQLIDTAFSKSLIDDTTYHYAKTVLLDSSFTHQFNQMVQPPAIDSSYSYWINKLFMGFILNSPSFIYESQLQQVYDTICQFFPKTDKLPTMFLINLVKLNANYYQLHEGHFFEDSFSYLDIIQANRRYIDVQKHHQFLTYILAAGHKYLDDQKYCQLILRIYFAHPQTISSSSLQSFLTICKNYQQISLLYLLLNKRPTPFIKQHISILNAVVQYLEQAGHLQQCMQLIKITNEALGTNAYQLLKQTRDRLISKLSDNHYESQLKINGTKLANGIFGFFNQALDKIKKVQKPIVDQPKSVYYDSIKKRYVVHGQIPDQEEETSVLEQKLPPPMPPRNIPLPPPPPGHKNNRTPNQSNQFQNKPVGVPPPRRGSRVPPNRNP